MKTLRINFFATNHDLHEILKETETKIKLFAFKSGPHTSKNTIISPSLQELEIKNDVCPTDSAHAPRYLIWGTPANINYRSLTTRNGDIKYIVDPDNNPDAIQLRPGGQNTPQIIIAGELSSTSDSKSANDLFKVIKNIITAKYKRIQSYYVGAEALEVLMNDGRLTSNSKAPREYDLSKPS